jgi:hypothetical protein
MIDLVVWLDHGSEQQQVSHGAQPTYCGGAPQNEWLQRAAAHALHKHKCPAGFEHSVHLQGLEMKVMESEAIRGMGGHGVGKKESSDKPSFALHS